MSTAASDFLTGPSKAWTAALGVTGPLFTFGAIEGQVRSAEAAKDEATLFYQQTILNALQETNSALVGSQKTGEQAEAQFRRVLALRNYARLSRVRFDNGAASYVEVLVAENDLFSAELNSVTSQADRLTQVVNVYKAMGGGWVDLGDQLAGPAAPGSPK